MELKPEISEIRHEENGGSNRTFMELKHHTATRQILIMSSVLIVPLWN